MRALVTGAAGFLGSHLAEALLQAGWQVRGVDAFLPAARADGRRANAAALLAWPGFTLAAVDLRSADLAPLLDGVDTVFHLAADTRAEDATASSPARFAAAVQHDLCATQRLLDAAAPVALTRFVYASSAAVYGAAPAYPTTESDLPRPRGVDGVTKLAAEHLCGLYAQDAGVPTVALRYFSVYGPRQRPDLTLHRFCRAALHGEPVEVRGDGSRGRSLLEVSDAVAATLAAARSPVPPGAVLNVGGIGATTEAELLDVLAALLGRELTVRRLPDLPGEVPLTYADNGRAAQLLGWAPRVPLRAGLLAQLDWHRSQSCDAGAAALATLSG